MGKAWKFFKGELRLELYLLGAICATSAPSPPG
jgi:hypothetical protein